MSLVAVKCPFQNTETVDSDHFFSHLKFVWVEGPTLQASYSVIFCEITLDYVLKKFKQDKNYIYPRIYNFQCSVLLFCGSRFPSGVIFFPLEGL